MAENRRGGYDGSVVDVSSVSEFVKGYQQQGLRKAAVMAAPFAIARLVGKSKRTK